MLLVLASFAEWMNEWMSEQLVPKHSGNKMQEKVEAVAQVEINFTYFPILPRKLANDASTHSFF